MHVARVGDAIVAIVCDGVSSAAAAADASAAAAEAAGAVLVASLDDPDADGSDADARRDDRGAGMRCSACRGRGRAAAVHRRARSWGHAGTAGRSPSARSATAVRTGSTIDVVEQLTVDDSWVQEQVAIGKLSESETHGHPYAHAITPMAGRGRARGRSPRHDLHAAVGGTARPVLRRPVELRRPTNTRMGAIVRAHPPATPPIEVARALTQIALASGGRDNITVVVVDVVPSTVATANGEGLT